MVSKTFTGMVRLPPFRRNSRAQEKCCKARVVSEGDLLRMTLLPDLGLPPMNLLFPGGDLPPMNLPSGHTRIS